MAKIINAEDVFIGDIYYNLNPYAVDVGGKFIGQVVDFEEVFVRFEEGYIPLTRISGQDHLEMFKNRNVEGFQIQFEENLLQEYPTSKSDYFIANLRPAKFKKNFKSVSFKDLEELKMSLADLAWDKELSDDDDFLLEQ